MPTDRTSYVVGPITAPTYDVPASGDQERAQSKISLSQLSFFFLRYGCWEAWA